MKQLECMIAWTPASWTDSRPETAGRVEVGPWPDTKGWSDAYASTVGACFAELHKISEWQRTAVLFIDFNTLVVRDGMDPRAVHEAFLAIDEYATKIAPDAPGARCDSD